MFSGKNNIAIIQPFIPTYRTDFFLGLAKEVPYDLFSFQRTNSKHRNGLIEGDVNFYKIKSYRLFNLRWFNPINILCKYNTIILCGEASILTNWLILIAGKLINRNILVWGHGATYSKPHPITIFHLVMYYLSRGGIFYTPKEMRYWRMKFPKKKMVALYNTLTVDRTYYKNLDEKRMRNILDLKKKYGIKQQTIFVSCYRFTNKSRRTDLLLKVIEELDPNKYAFIIIGDGFLKPDFALFQNVYDFGAVWDNKRKTELFFVSDFYLQFGGIGLSIVEGMAYSKPVITMRRSKEIKHGTEYYYLRNRFNSIILSDIKKFEQSLIHITPSKYVSLSHNALRTYNNELQMSRMIKHMKSAILEI